MRNQKPSIFFFVLLFLCVGKSFAQLSDLHYLPPLKQRATTGAVDVQSVYLSTPSTTAFNVDVYVGTSATPVTTISISNTSPGEYSLTSGNNDITMVSDTNTGIVLANSGLRFESENGEDFYVNYRAYSGSQATSLTSKGRAAMGTEFRWGGIPQSRSGNVNNTTTLGIMATEDNTSVTISGYDPDSEFRLGSDAGGITDNTLTINLDANESYVVEAVVDQTDANLEGWLGALVSSDKDIVISNGGLNYSVLSTSELRDAGIDQPVPVDLLGKEYIFVRGNGGDTLEFAIILATENDTDIYVGSSGTPAATIDAGEYYRVDGTNYSGTSAGSNMYVRTSKNAYAYQNIAGTTSAANIGMNFIAPVSCLLPDALDNISDITNIAGLSFTSGITIIASTASADNDIVVTDGTGVVTKPASQAVPGNSDWKTFYMSGLSGNVEVTSTSSIAVGFFGYVGDRSVAGYFSGFDNVSDVNVSVTGDVCLPGASLAVTNSGDYQSFQWFFNGEEIVGATSDTYNPTEAGDYFVRVSKSNCDYDSQTTSVYYCNPDVYVRKTADTNSIDDGDTVNFTIRVQNLGNAPVTNLVVTDALPAGLTLVDATPSTGSWSSPNWTIGTLASGAVQTLIIEATADYVVGNDGSSNNITNTVSHTQDQTDSNATTDDLSETIQVTNNTLLNLPAFTSANTVNFAENGTGTVLNVDANNGDGGSSDAGITYSLASGGDNDLFSIDASTGELTFQSAPDFESPNDANTDNNYQITVTALDSDGSSNQLITVSVTNLDDTVTITDFSPKAAGNGETITISGSNFTGTTSVQFGGTAAASFNVDSDNQITAVVGAGSSGDLTVINPLGNATATDFVFINLLQEDGSPTQWAHTDGDYGFYYDIPNPVYFKAPEGMYIQLVTEEYGSFHTIESGLNEIPDVEEYLKSVGLNVDAKGWGGIFYKHSDGSNGCCDWSYWVKQHYAIAYRLPPTIDSFTPNSVLKDDTVTITGTNFLGTTSVTFGGVDATSFTIDSATQITATVGTGASGDVAVTTSGGTGTLSGFTHNFIPVFTDPTAPFEVSFEENNTASAANIDANDGAGSPSDAEITYALAAGGDNDLFNIDEASGILTFINPPDYENPTDANTDNTYEVSITATASGGDNSMDLDVMVTDKDEIAPNGYNVEIDQDFINPDNEAAVSFTFTDAEVGATYDYTFSSDGGGTDVTGTGTITTATDQISSIDLSGLGDGTITLSVTLTDDSNNEGNPATDDIEKDTTAPNGYTVVINQNPIDADNENAASFTFADAEVGATYDYTFSSDGGGTDVTGTGTIATATDQISSIDLSGLEDGTITLSVTLTDDSNNEGNPASDDTTKDTDSDGDGIKNNVDNCPSISNNNQLDTDSDGEGDVCDIDDDGDGTPDVDDAFPLDDSEDTDTDGDGIGNNTDTDDDNDLLLDGEDPNPLVDTQTTTPAMTLPATDGTSYDNLTINYYVPEAPLANSVRLIFESVEDVNSPITLQLQDPVANDINTFDIDAKNLASASEVVSASSSSLVNGAAYDITLVYQDALGNDPAEVTNTNHTIITDLEFTYITITSDNASPELARQGDRISVEFGFNRAVNQVALSILGATIMFDDSALIGENTYLGYIEVNDAMSEGPVGFTLTANPSTDNLVASTTTDGSSVTIDTTGPQPSLVIDESLYLEPFTIQLQFSEPVFNLAPYPVMIAPDGNGQPMANLGALQEVTPGLVYNITVTPLIPGELVFFNDNYGIARDEAGNDTKPLGFVNGMYYDLDSDNDGIGDSTDTDDDNDGTPDSEDAFPFDDSEHTDTDGDGTGDNTDDDDDNDGTPDSEDAFPLDDSEDTDTDGDGSGDNADADDDNDGTPDSEDDFPLDGSEDTDTDGDGQGDNADDDIDGDGIPNDEDVYPDGEITDMDNDGVPDAEDAFPNDPNESVDSDGDGTGDNADEDDDNDGTPDSEDAFPFDDSEDTDTDGDGTGDNTDDDIDGDGVPNDEDVYPNGEIIDTDNDGVPDAEDAFPNDPNESMDSDGDGQGDNVDTDDDNDGTPDTEDAFPWDASEDTDTDGDGQGDNSDPDDDNDGTPDSEDAFPKDSSEDSDNDGDGIGDNGDDDDDNDGVPDGDDDFPMESEPSIIPAQAFTPNGDGNNDTWIVPGIENYPNNVVRVFNRYGHEVFATQSYHNDWGGIYKENREKLPAGSYLYVIDLGDGSAPMEGWIFINY
ncbi:gliding motility-associated C-terminal domain-containing protein [Muricauda sp. CAU 1633]|uniref:T9SS type B sorting domain-containing protein n=1 Tax=Allomuricauda sp. CAU 1633 TaxID=2816036 RepID=UPI001A8E8990|nr:gliding motility-associated C-terminal domain-containing protein [Muricauda sp. CAU 1633]MBO0322299.1 gliding motility-associated C-terminal domain-containing protein [Muricauda sp. CAU 1633]